MAAHAKDYRKLYKKLRPMPKTQKLTETDSSAWGVETPTFPFEITSMDITGPYLLTPRKNKYLLTFVDHFTRYVEVYPIPDETAETCAQIYATQIVTRHGTGSKLITDQGRKFVVLFLRNLQNIGDT